MLSAKESCRIGRAAPFLLEFCGSGGTPSSEGGVISLVGLGRLSELFWPPELDCGFVPKIGPMISELFPLLKSETSTCGGTRSGWAGVGDCTLFRGAEEVSTIPSCFRSEAFSSSIVLSS
jgi:hypothetical protein